MTDRETNQVGGIDTTGPSRRWRIAFFAGAGLAVFLILYYLRTVLTPVFIALVIAYVLDPLVDKMESRRISRPLAALVPLIGALLILGLILAFFIPFLIDQVRGLINAFPAYLEKLREMLGAVMGIEKGGSIPELGESVLKYLQENSPLSTKAVLQPLPGIAARVLGNTLALATGFFSLLIIPLFSYYLLRDLDRIKAAVVSYFPPSSRESWVGLFREIDGVLSGFIRGQLTVCTILAVLYSVGLFFIGIDYAILVGVLTGYAFLIPYLGTVLGALVALILSLVEFGFDFHLLLVLGWIALVQLAESYYITPRIVGGQLGMSVLEVILALLIGGQIFGFLGIVIAIPMAAILKVVFRRLLAAYRGSRYFQETPPDSSSPA